MSTKINEKRIFLTQDVFISACEHSDETTVKNLLKCMTDLEKECLILYCYGYISRLHEIGILKSD